MENIIFDENEYLNLLSYMISKTKFLQNNGQDLIPREKEIIDIILEELRDSINIRKKIIEYVENRGNLILEYPNDDNYDKTISFVGSHMDVVPANPDLWTKYPFTMIIEGDKLYGRGTTDCLGHVALLTLLIKYLDKFNIKLNYKIIIVFIANEECGDDIVGIEHLSRDGYLNNCKKGPVYWLDSSDTHPVLATGSGMGLELTVTGKKTHGGFPFNGVNPLPIAFDVSRLIVEHFNKLCSPLDIEKEYGYKTSSNMKPTVIKIPDGGSINQNPDKISITFDVRITPFYDSYNIFKCLEEYVKEINENIDLYLKPWHSALQSKIEGFKSEIILKKVFGPYKGAKCNNKSLGFKLLRDSTIKNTGVCNPTSELGSLPLISDLIDMGLDIQITGYGIGEVYHGNDEYCTLSGMKTGFYIIRDILIEYL